MANPILDYPITYRGFTINPERDTSGDIVRANNADTIVLRRFDFSPLVVRDQIEGLHLESGSDFGVFTREQRRISLMGDLRGNDDEALADREARFLSTFDGEEAVRTSPETEGASAIDFWCPTDAPPGALTSPVHEMFLARPHGFPISYQERSRGTQQRVAAELVCADPKRYVYEPTVIVFSGAEPWSQPFPNWPLGVGALTYPVFVIEVAATIPPETGQAPDITISDGTTSLELDCGENMPTGHDATFTVDMGRQRITRTIPFSPDLDGDRAVVRTSAIDTFFGIPPGGSTITITHAGPGGFDQITSVTATYRMARA